VNLSCVVPYRIPHFNHVVNSNPVLVQPAPRQGIVEVTADLLDTQLFSFLAKYGDLFCSLKCALLWNLTGNEYSWIQRPTQDDSYHSGHEHATRKGGIETTKCKYGL
jgi:hypothetical protein